MLFLAVLWLDQSEAESGPVHNQIFMELMRDIIQEM